MNNDNFLAFIEDDIATKNVLLSSMPVKTKADIKKYNDKIDTMTEKYNAYKRGVRAYIETKSKSFDIKAIPKDIKLTELVSALESVRFLLNPNNTYVEKMGFDNLLYELSNYYEFNFKSLNKIINQFIDKFELAGIKLTGDDFDYTVYVKEYMTAFIETRNSKTGSYEKVSKIFEKIYWVNSDIIEHVELNLRKLIRKNKHALEHYVKDLQNKVMQENNISNYKDCLTKLKSLYIELELQEKEGITDIITLAKTGDINITNYFEESKFRNATYTNLMIEEIDLKNEDIMAKFYNNLTKLKANVEEYMNYIRFMPMIKHFRTEYEKIGTINIKESNKKVKALEDKISTLEKKLERINNQLSEDHNNLTKLLSLVGPKPTQSDAFKIVKELAELYKTYDKEYFTNKVAVILKSTITIPEVLELYYSFDFFKKQAIKKVFNINSYDEIVKYSENFDLFVMNLNNVIIHGIFVFEDNNIDQIIINKYRFDNINLTIEELSSEELSVLLEKIKFLLRINEIDHSPVTVEKIWFITQVEKIKKAEESV